jgi:serine protease
MYRRLARRLAAAAIPLLVTPWAALPGRADTPPVPALAPPARVIVVLKANGPLLREHAMSVRQSAQAVATAAQGRADSLAARAGVTLSAGLAISERAQVVTARGIDGAALARRLAADPEVESAVVDQRRRALLVPADPLFAAGPASGRGPEVGQWYLRAPRGEVQSAVNAQGAWDLATGHAGVVVAVLDTGVLADHLDLAGQVLPGYDMVSDPATANDGDGRDADASDPGDWITVAENGARGGDFYNCRDAGSSWHGTKVAGIIGAAANNGQGMAGTAFGVKILPVRVLGKCGGFDSDILAGMRWAAGLAVPGVPGNPNRAQVINLSLGGQGACASSGYPAVIAEVLAAGTSIVVAAGNSAGRDVELPANCPGVIAVAGLRHAGSKVGFSDLGTAIAISAPAGNCINIKDGEPCLYPILSSSNSGTQKPLAGGSVWTDSFDYSVGTSFAAPIAAGTAALMLSARPRLEPAELRSLMQASARAFPTSGAGNDENGQPVPMCRAPDGTDQLQCYCSVGLCGAGMLDAAGAVAAAMAVPLARIDAGAAQVTVGDSLRLSAGASEAGAGRTLVAYAWSVAGSGAAAAGFAGPTDAAEAELWATAAGPVTLTLVVTDDSGLQASAQRQIDIVAAAEPPAASGGGGGASSLLWVALLGLAVAALQHTRRRGAGIGRA